jgi:hypothetical protein
MPKQKDGACEMKTTGEIGDAPLMPSDESAIVLEPGTEPLDFPASLVPAQRAPILGEIDPIQTIGAISSMPQAARVWSRVSLS